MNEPAPRGGSCTSRFFRFTQPERARTSSSANLDGYSSLRAKTGGVGAALCYRCVLLCLSCRLAAAKETSPRLPKGSAGFFHPAAAGTPLIIFVIGLTASRKSTWPLAVGQPPSLSED
jgi:hypothetical protein